MAESNVQTSAAGRHLIVNIDDLGMCDSTVRAAVEILGKGNASSTTVMMPCSWAPSAIDEIGGFGGVDVGVHLTLFSEFPGYRWGPVCDRGLVESLLDDSGMYFYSEAEMERFIANADVSQAEKELRAQIEAARRLGLQPTHLDGHCHGHERRDDIFVMTLNLSRSLGLALRIAFERHRQMAGDLGFSVIDHDTLDSMRIPSEAKPARYQELLENLPPGVSEWAIHPAVETDEIKRIAPADWESRVADYRFFRSEEFARLLEQERIELTRYSLYVKD